MFVPKPTEPDQFDKERCHRLHEPKEAFLPNRMAPNLNLFERKSTPDSLAPSNLEPVQSFSPSQHPASESKQSHLSIRPRAPKAHLYRPARQGTLPRPSSSKIKRPYPTVFQLCNLQTRVAWSLGDELAIRLRVTMLLYFVCRSARVSQYSLSQGNFSDVT
jgi:hypothetical protein